MENKMNPFRPMLAAVAVSALISFPCYASPKLDGVRALVMDGVVMSRSMKPIRNEHVQALFGRPELNGLDGELILGEPTQKDVYRLTQSVVNSTSKDITGLRFYAFDKWDLDRPFNWRKVALEGQVRDFLGDGLRLVRQGLVLCQADLDVYEDHCLEQGYEGVMLRAPQSPYKQGRSTTKQGYLLKVKRFSDSEARVLAVEELMHNGNEATTNELGRTSRSSHQENLVPAGTMGALLVEDIHTGQVFRIGTGFSAEERAEWWIWANPSKCDCEECANPLRGLIVKYRFFPIGVKDLPRHPSYQGLRDMDDLGGE